jgi:hypothetical protein
VRLDGRRTDGPMGESNVVGAFAGTRIRLKVGVAGLPFVEICGRQRI